MRKQYHFRNGLDGLLAWDVDKLIALAKGIEPEMLALDEIRELDEAYWYDVGGDAPTCRSIAAHVRLIADADLAYPIIVCPRGRVMDGMHRVVKALAAGHASIAACRLVALPPPDFVGIDPDDLDYDEA